MVVALLMSAAQAAASPAAVPAAAPNIADALRVESRSSGAACRNEHGSEIVVCGRQGSRYRIDPVVLETQRARDALPPKPPVGADTVADNGCVGGRGDGCTNGGVIPLVGMALAAVKAAELAANGDDWRDAIRTHEDEYRIYKQAEERKAKERGVKIGISTGE
jgi:hypothetical protein